MRAVLGLLFICLSFPAIAQLSPECKGKQSFKLTDGSRGCLIETGLTGISRTTRRDDGNSKTNTRRAYYIHVAMFGQRTDKKVVSEPRLKEICRIFTKAVSGNLKSNRVKAVAIRMSWPGQPRIEETVNRRFEYDDQSAYMNLSCKSVKFLPSGRSTVINK